jgi:deoxyribose-phosphate aldolase
MTKMIIETSMLTNEEIVTATKLVAEAGIDWVKTSTGQYAGPSVSEVLLMVDTLKGTKTKVKVAGVKAPRPQNAFAFFAAGAELIGTQGAAEILDAVADMRRCGLCPEYEGD